MEVRHKDGNRRNNIPGNLCWGTSSENRADSRKHGTLSNQNTGKTVCKRGHPLEGDNLYTNKRNQRQCKTCRNNWRRIRKENLAKRQTS